MADGLRENPKQRDIVGDAAQENALSAPEEVSNQARGHKANLSNPNTSEESKKNSEQKLKELGGDDAFFSKDKTPTPRRRRRRGVAQQGEGLVKGYRAAYSPAYLSKSRLDFYDTAHRATLEFAVVNDSPNTVTYTLSNIAAGTVYALNGLYIRGAQASISFSPGNKITVKSNGGWQTMRVTPTDPAGLEGARLPVWSGFVALNGSDGSPLTLPYSGLGCNLASVQTVHNVEWRREDPAAAPGTEPRPLLLDGATGGWASARTRAGTRSQDAASGKVVGAPSIGDERDQSTSGGSLKAWDGKMRDGKKCPDGTYVLNARALRPFGDANKADDWAVVKTQRLTINWTS